MLLEAYVDNRCIKVLRSQYQKIHSDWIVLSYTATMKLSTLLFVLATSLVSAMPTRTIEEGAANVLIKRASITDAANIGYATQNGG